MMRGSPLVSPLNPESVSVRNMRCKQRRWGVGGALRLMLEAVGHVARSSPQLPLPALRRVARPLSGCLLLLGSCSAQPRVLEVSLRALEQAEAVHPSGEIFAIAADESALRSLYSPLGSRLGLIEIARPQEWERLRAAAPGVGPCPDLRRGVVVGVLSRTGRPLDTDAWPIRLDTVRSIDGAGYVTAEFEGGTYLPDGTTYLALAQLDGVHSVLLVEVNGVRFYPN